MVNMTFEENYPIIIKEINKRRSRWNLTSINWMDFDDVVQIVSIHISKKWDMYDKTQPLLPWLNKIISNQIRNIARNHYVNFVRPCLKCPAAQDGELCSIYQTQCIQCPLYKHWFFHKKNAHDTKMPLPLEYHATEVNMKPESGVDLIAAIKQLNEWMSKNLKPNDYIVYKMLYIDNLCEKDVAEKLNFTTSEKGCNPGYRQIRNIKKIILGMAKKCLREGHIEI